MIQGLRLLPWLQEATRRNPDAVAHYSDCDKCKGMLSREVRQSIGCGYEPENENATPWTPEGWTGESPTVCVGYATKLPEVLETTEARFYLKHGSLGVLVGGELSDALRVSIRLLENADNEASIWAIKNK